MPGYGRVPHEDVQAVHTALEIAARTVAHLPPQAPESWRSIAYELVLNGVLDDWVTNGTNDLDEGDEEDLASLLRVAADAALAQEPGFRDSAFQAVCRNAMQDWVKNWNLED